jgi:hypothetical protein
MIAAATAPAVRADDGCRYQRTAIDETICADKWLALKRHYLDGLYHSILRRLDQAQRDKLILDQEKWSDGLGPKCANKIKYERERCIHEAIDGRSAQLSKTFPTRAADSTATRPAAAADQKPFEGHWEHCQKWKGVDICSYHTLFQKGDRICGIWEYFATNSFYQGRLVWTANGKVADKRYICGRVGGEVSHWCPDDGAGTSQPGWGQKGWEATTGTEVICSVGSARFLASLEAPCGVTTKEARVWRALDAKQREMLNSEKWLKTCLDDPAYPDKGDIVDPSPR